MEMSIVAKVKIYVSEEQSQLFYLRVFFLQFPQDIRIQQDWRCF